jgi:uncharacterized protein YbaR (Trm112 family)
VHLLLTERLTCPRCGPAFGLILLADRMEERRVLDGQLGCPNCRDTYPVSDGFGDLRAPPRGDLPGGRAGAPGAVDEREVRRLMALIGVQEGPGIVAFLGAMARFAAPYTELVPGVEVVALDAALAQWPSVPRVNRMVSRPGIPILGGTLRGVAVDGVLGFSWIRESARVVAPLGRVVVGEAPEGTDEALIGEGLGILAAEGGTVVAARG